MTSKQSWDVYPTPSDLPTPVINDETLPLVSIVTPSYNQGEFIAETIESVLSQDYPNIEYWVIDGGSTDETLSILKSYDDDPRFHWLSEHDQGQADAVNKGWCRCQGSVLGWLNSDDTYLPQAIRMQTMFLHAHSEVAIVYGDAILTDAQGRRIGKYWARKFSQYEQLRASCIPQPTAFVRRACVARNGTIDTSLDYALDYEYWLRASFHSMFAYLPEEIATYRIHSSSKTGSEMVKFNPELEAVIQRFFEREDVPPVLQRKRKILYADVLLRLGLNCIKNGDTSSARKYLIQSMSYSPRPRVLLMLLYMIDPTHDLIVARSFNEKWMQLRSKWSRRE